MSSRNFGSNIVTFENFTIYTKPCKSCPPGIDPWIRQLCKNLQWYVQIDADWAGDWFNQYGISQQVEDFDAAIELITDQHSSEWSNYTDKKIISIHQQALKVYGMLHARWICQPKGMSLMKEKYEKGIFGKCPRYECHGTNMLPMGTTFTVRRHSTKLFCPNCYDIYRAPPNIILDGAHFGPAFPHMFLCDFQKFDKSKDFKPFELKAFGFKVHRKENSRYLVHSKNKYEEEIPDQ